MQLEWLKGAKGTAKARGPKPLHFQLEVGAQRAPKLLVVTYILLLSDKKLLHTFQLTLMKFVLWI